MSVSRGINCLGFWLFFCWSLPVLANTPPTMIPFSDNETVNAQLSTVDMNRITVRDDRIKSIQCPKGYCVFVSKQNDDSGSTFLTLNVFAPFTMYVMTEKGRQFGVFVLPKATPPITTIFVGLDNQAKEIDPFESKSPYQQRIAALVKDMIAWSEDRNMESAVPFRAVPQKEITRLERKAKKSKKMAVVPVATFDDKQLKGTVYRLVNYTKTSRQIKVEEFYTRAARAAAVSDKMLSPNAQGFLYLVTGPEVRL